MKYCDFRKVQDSWAALDDAGDPTGNACFASEWYEYLTERVHDIIRWSTKKIVCTLKVIHFEFVLYHKVTPTSRCWRRMDPMEDIPVARRSTRTTRQPPIPCTGRTSELRYMKCLSEMKLSTYADCRDNFMRS